ncbi:ATP-dependent DNA ligase [Pseudomonas antarctica]|uniref:ATP-dependent DNA ligase n=1 Tax=Pseudomonas antarctica TaxID=219572 RepID=UPI00387A931F
MSKVQRVIIATNPHRPVDFSEKAVSKVLAESYAIADVKEDGVRLNLCVEPDVTATYFTEWLSREGKRFPAIGEFNGPLDCDERWSEFFETDEALFPEGFMLDAELRIDDLPCKDIAGTLRRHQAIDLSRLKVIVFGILPMSVVRSGQDYDVTHSVMKYHVEYQVKLLQERFPEIAWSVVESLDCFSMEEVDTLYESVRERKLEGLVLKDPNGIYKRSKQSGMWKMTPDDNEDGKVVGLVWGTPGLANEGKVIGFEVLLESGHVVNACKISKALMDEFTDKVMAHRYASADNDMYYLGWTAKVTFMERYPDGSLRHPSFDSFRGISEPTIKE